ncbi:MAG: glycosyltransferase [Candidatus Bathyarchaeia archaeon]
MMDQELAKQAIMGIVFVGGARYSQPLDHTSAKKFQLLAQLGEIFVIGFSQDIRPRYFKEHAQFYLLPKWPLPALRYLTLFLIGPWLALWLIWRRGVQVLVAQSPYEGFAAALSKKISGWFKRKIVLIIESHGDFEESLFLQRRVRLPSLYRFLMRHVAKFALKHADLLRAISNSTRAQLEQWAPGKPIVQFPTWTDIEAFFKVGAAGEKTFDAIVFAGVLTSLKGVHVLIDAFAQVAQEFPDAQLWIIGKAENKGYAQLLKAQVARLGLNGRVIFMNAMPQQELARKIAQARALVLPSLSEGLGRVVIEAMACSIPVIGSRVGGIPEIIQDGVTGFLVLPGDVNALAQRIRWILSHPEEAKQMGQRAREFAERFFSAKAYQQGYVQLLQMAESLLKECGHHAPPAL